MKKPLVVGSVVGVALLLVLFVVWFLRLGDVGGMSGERIDGARVTDVQGTVEMRIAGGSVWSRIDSSAEVKTGDAVRTGDGSRAVIHWSDRGETRLDPKTEIEIAKAPENWDTLTKSVIDLRLKSGRAWSRFLKLVDIDSETSVRAQNVVATVRGTAFGFAATDEGAELAVTESVVQIGAANAATSTLVREGRWGRFTDDASPVIVRDLRADDAWPQQNASADETFDIQFLKDAQAYFQEIDGGKDGFLTRLSERVALSLLNERERPERRVRYFERRLARTLDAFIHGRDYSFSFDSSLYQDLTPELREVLLRDVRRALAVIGPTGQSAPELAKQLREVRRELVGQGDTRNRWYASALDIDDGIDAIVRSSAILSASERLQRVKESLAAIDRLDEDMRGVAPASAADIQRMKAKSAAMRERLRLSGAGVDDGAAAKPVEAVPAVTSTTPGAATSSTPTSQIPKENLCQILRVNVFVDPSTAIRLGDRATLRVLAACKDGHTENYTSRAIFRLANPEDGSLQGTVFLPSHAGTATVNATVVDDLSRSFTASAVISIAPKTKNLVSLKVSALGSTSVSGGQTVPLEATASYSDGTTASVKYQCGWTVSDPRMGLVSNNSFQALQGSGRVTVSCKYTENQTTLTGSVMFDVQTASPTPRATTGGTFAPTTNLNVGKP